MDLLEKASVILTPTAYNNGEALCVKPSDGSGDFDFSRNSAATRVNAQGLVENVQILSSNLVQNGDFSEEGAEEVSNGSFSQEGSELITNGDFTNNIDGWISYGSISTWDNGTIKTTCTSNTAWIRQNGAVTINKYYKVTFKAKASNISQNIKIYNGSTFKDTGLSFDEVDVYQEFTYYLYTTVSQIIIGQQSVSVGDTINFDNVSCVEVGQDWTLGTGWSIGEDKALADLTSSNDWLNQTNVFTSGKIYKVSFEVLDYTSGSINLSLHSAWSQAYSANGVYTNYLTATGVNLKFSSLANNFNGSITNISVKEVGQNWELGAGFSIGENLVDANLTTNAQLKQNFVFTSGKNYKVSFEILNYTSGSINLSLHSVWSEAYSANGVYTEYFTATQTLLKFESLPDSFVGSITNISVIEITDDTNLPRINYEGFSYQDALGSELVVNGGFDDGGANWVNISNLAVFENSSVIFENNARIYQGVVSDLTKTYNIEIQFSSISGNGIQLLFGNGNSFVSYSVSDIINNGNKINISKESFIGSGILFIYSQNSSTSAVIDNVSVKEYLGQSVVPNSGCGSWLFESQSTNLITYSSDYTQWNKSGSMVITSNNAISPDGTQNADLLTANAANQFIYLSSFSSANSTISLYIKRKTGTGSIELSNNGGASYTALSVTDEWSRVQVTFATSTNQTVIKINTSGDEIYLWGVQVEALSYASSLIPTSGSQVTRNQDVCNNGATGTGLINSTEGVLYAEIKVFDSDNSYKMIEINDGSSSNNRVVLYVYGSNILGFIKSNGNTNLNVFSAETVTNFNKVAIKWGSVDTALWVNGVEINTGTASTFTQNLLSDLSFLGAGTQYFFGKTKALAVFPYLSDQELTELTTI